MSYTKSDIFVLNAIHKLGGVNELTGAPIKTITKLSNLSDSKVRNAVRILQSESLILEGFMQKNAKTYYVSENGIKLLNRLKLRDNMEG